MHTCRRFVCRSGRQVSTRCSSSSSSQAEFEASSADTNPRTRQVLPTTDKYTASEDGRRTERKREHGQRSLPVPSLLDPRLYEVRQQHRQAGQKQKPEDRTPFQQKLAANAYANALATPLRKCVFSEAVLPTHFLQPFHLARQSRSTTSNDDEESKTSYRSVVLPVSLRDKNNHLAAKSYTTLSYTFITQLARTRRYRKLLSNDTGSRFGIKHRKNVEWEADTPNTIRTLLEEEVVTTLRWGFAKKRVLWSISSMERKRRGRDIACLLRLRSSSEGSAGLETDSETKVYDLSALLTGPRMEELLRDSPYREEELVVVESDERTVKARLALMRLERYVQDST